MKGSRISFKVALLCIGALLGSVFSPVIKKNSVLRMHTNSEDPVAVHARIEKNLNVIEQYMDAKYGEGFFKEHVMQHASKTEMLSMLDTERGLKEYKKSLVGVI